MNPDPKKTKIISSRHSIEIGSSTWDSKEISIRNRYNSKQSGKFSRSGSSELPIEDLVHLMEAAAKYDLLEVEECTAIIEILAKSIQRQRRLI